MSADHPHEEAKSAKICVICGRPAANAFAPFCSKRCADVDLHRWLSGAYVVPGDEPADADPTRDDRGPEA